MLKVRSLDVFYGRVHALRSVSLHVRPGETVALIGANGAGKSTLLSAVSGLIRPAGGDIVFEGRSLLRLSPGAVVRRGVIQAPEGRQLFAPLTVWENLEMGAYTRMTRAGRQDVYQELEGILDRFPVLRERRDQAAGTLSGGEQQMLAIGRAMVGAPRLLLLDEPSLGLAPMMVDEVFRIIRSLKGRGVTILLVEQNARGALEVSDRAYVLETGRITLSGPSADLMGDPEVKRAFLGKDYTSVREI